MYPDQNASKGDAENLINRVGNILTINNYFMNKVKMFFIAAALVLTTAGVFAGKARFAQITQIYDVNGVQVLTATANVAFYNTNDAGTFPAYLRYNNVNYDLYANAAQTARAFIKP